jgi:hypothetical protein
MSLKMELWAIGAMMALNSMILNEVLGENV